MLLPLPVSILIGASLLGTRIGVLCGLQKENPQLMPEIPSQVAFSSEMIENHYNSDGSLLRSRISYELQVYHNSILGVSRIDLLTSSPDEFQSTQHLRIIKDSLSGYEYLLDKKSGICVRSGSAEGFYNHLFDYDKIWGTSNNFTYVGQRIIRNIESSLWSSTILHALDSTLSASNTVPKMVVNLYITKSSPRSEKHHKGMPLSSEVLLYNSTEDDLPFKRVTSNYYNFNTNPELSVENFLVRECIGHSGDLSHWVLAFPVFDGTTAARILKNKIEIANAILPLFVRHGNLSPTRIYSIDVSQGDRSTGSEIDNAMFMIITLKYFPERYYRRSSINEEILATSYGKARTEEESLEASHRTILHAVRSGLFTFSITVKGKDVKLQATEALYYEIPDLKNVPPGTHFPLKRDESSVLKPSYVLQEIPSLETCLSGCLSRPIEDCQRVAYSETDRKCWVESSDPGKSQLLNDTYIVYARTRLDEYHVVYGVSLGTNYSSWTVSDAVGMDDCARHCSENVKGCYGFHWCYATKKCHFHSQSHTGKSLGVKESDKEVWRVHRSAEATCIHFLRKDNRRIRKIALNEDVDPYYKFTAGDMAGVALGMLMLGVMMTGGYLILLVVTAPKDCVTSSPSTIPTMSFLNLQILGESTS